MWLLHIALLVIHACSLEFVNLCEYVGHVHVLVYTFSFLLIADLIIFHLCSFLQVSISKFLNGFA